MSTRLSGATLRWWVWCSVFLSFGAFVAAFWLTPLGELFYGLLVDLDFNWLLPLELLLGVGMLSAIALMALVLGSDNFSGSDWHSNGFKSMVREFLEFSDQDRCDHPEQHYSFGRGRPMCGVSVGGGLAVCALLVRLTTQMVPAELDTLSVLLQAGARLDGGAAPVLEKRSTGDAMLLASDGAQREPVLDSFGNAITFARSDDPRTQYTLRSLGRDGRWSTDDLCVYGHTQDLPISGKPAGSAEFRRTLSAGRLAWEDSLAALRQSRCTSLGARSEALHGARAPGLPGAETQGPSVAPAQTRRGGLSTVGTARVQ